MLKLLFGKEEVLPFERTYPAPIDAVWYALTTPTPAGSGRDPRRRS